MKRTLISILLILLPILNAAEDITDDDIKTAHKYFEQFPYRFEGSKAVPPQSLEQKKIQFQAELFFLKKPEAALKIVKELIGNKKTEERITAKAMRFLAFHRSEIYESFIINNMSSIYSAERNDIYGRSYLFDYLKSIKSKKVIPVLLGIGAQSEDSIFRPADIASYCGELKAREAVTYISSLLEHPKSEYISQAITTAGTIGDEKFVPLLCALGEQKNYHAQERIRSQIADALGKIGSSKAIPYLEKSVYANPRSMRMLLPELKALLLISPDDTAEIISKIENVYLLKYVDHETAIPVLLKIFRNQQHSYRDTAAKMLAEYNVKSIIPELEHSLLFEEYSPQFMSALYALDPVKGLFVDHWLQSTRRYSSEGFYPANVNAETIKYVRNSFDKEMTLKAFTDLCVYGDSIDVSRILKYCRETEYILKHHSVRESAVNYLNTIKAEGVGEVLLQIMKVDSNSELRFKALKGVTLNSTSDDVMALWELYKTLLFWNDRSIVVFGRIFNEWQNPAVKSEISTFMDKAPLYRRFKPAYLLARMGDEKGRRFLNTIIDLHETYPGLHQFPLSQTEFIDTRGNQLFREAAKWLALLGDAKALKLISEIFPEVSTGWQDEGLVDTLFFASPNLRFLESAALVSSEEVRIKAISLLSEYGDEASYTFIRDYLAGKKPGVNLALHEAASKIKYRLDKNTLQEQELFQDNGGVIYFNGLMKPRDITIEKYIRNKTSSVFIHYPDERAIPMLLEELKLSEQDGKFIGVDSERPKDAMWGLINIGEPAVEPLIKLYNSDDSIKYRYRILKIFQTIKDKRTIPVALKALKTKEPWDTYEGITLLASFNDRTHIPVIGTLLDHETSSIRYHALRTLETYGGKEAVDILVSQLNRKDNPTQRRIITALGRMGDKRVIIMLIQKTKDETFWSRFANPELSIALKKLTGKNFKTYDQWIKWYKEEYMKNSQEKN